MLTKDDANKIWNNLIDLDDYLDGCKTCSLPDLLHKGNQKEVRVQTSRGKVANTKFSLAENDGSPLNKMFMVTESLSWWGSQEARNRRESITRRQDSQVR